VRADACRVEKLERDPLARGERQLVVAPADVLPQGLVVLVELDGSL
jgi:hypothetical protein